MNISKKDNWAKLNYSGDMINDYYFVYSLSPKDRGKFLNTWFYSNKLSRKKDYIMDDIMVTLKKVDKETCYRLCYHWYNPVVLLITAPTGCRFKFNELGERLYEMKATIRSIDDSSFGIWWIDIEFEKLVEIRKKLMIWISSFKVLNGEKFLDYCVELGANPKYKDYN